MMQQTEQTKNYLLSFLTPTNLEEIICDHIIENIKKLNKYVVKCDHTNLINIFDNKYKLCKIKIVVTQQYNIQITYNSNIFIIEKMEDIFVFIKLLETYFAKLNDFYTYVNLNYYVVYPNDLTQIAIYDNCICVLDGCCCEATRKIKYIFDCDATNFILFESDYQNKKCFDTVSAIEMTTHTDILLYKNKCKVYCCC